MDEIIFLDIDELSVDNCELSDIVNSTVDNTYEGILYED